MADPSRHGSTRLGEPGSSSTPGRSAGAGEGNAAQNASTASATETTKPKKKKHRAGRKRKNRRQSFIAPSEATEDTVDVDGRPSLLQASRANAAQQASFYRWQANGNRSNTSLESEALLDHRELAPVRTRRDTIKSGFARVAMPFHRNRPSDSAGQSPSAPTRPHLSNAPELAVSDDERDYDGANDRTPLLSRGKPHLLSRNNSGLGYGSHGSSNKGARRTSNTSKASSRRRIGIDTTVRTLEEPHDVNNPPSVPGSPTLGSMDDIFLSGASDRGRERDAIIEIARDDIDSRYSISPEGMRRRPTVAELAERDVCFPGDEEGSDHAIEEEFHEAHRSSSRTHRRRRTRHWPDLDVLEEWSREEKEERTHQDLLRAKKISEPVMVGGRLRPAKTQWHREEDDSPFRFTYFNETLDGTIHARTISDLQDGMTFKELFLPDPVELSDDSDDDADPLDENALERPALRPRHHSNESAVKPSGGSTLHQSPARHEGSVARTASVISKSVQESAPASGNVTPKPRSKRYGARPTFWLDVLKPTETEMKVLSKAFGIHQLTSEDILMDEPREKVELFPSYYFVNYRTFEQDKDSDEYMEPINMYVIVFRNGVITFHHSMSPHPANVRRRIRQLNDYMSPTADWISYAIIDDVTDVYAPLVSEIEQEVDEIDEDILYMHTTAADQAVASSKTKSSQKQPKERPKSAKGNKPRQTSAWETQTLGEVEEKAEKSGGDMLRQVGESRKKVMSLYRLLGNKADVIKGFAKRCNEHWEVAPRSEIGLYLGDIQDHIVTMTGNLAHYESLLSRAHGNYVAQINIRMNERAEQNADVLGKLTVLGTIVLPMNIITGMWGMNVWVPGQEIEGDLTWFFCITAGLIGFGLVCYFVAKKVYGIV